MHSEEQLSAMAQRCLTDVDDLASAFMEEVSHIPPYSDGAVPSDVLRPDTEASFELMLRIIAELPIPARIDDVCERIGRHRAQVGVPLDVLLRVIRIDFTILWEALLNHADEAQFADLVRSAGRVWDALEQYTVRIQLAYLNETALLARERDHELSALVSAMLANEGREPLLTQVATALDMRLDARFAIAAAPPRSEPVLREAALKLQAGGVPLHVQDVAHRAVLIAQLPRGKQQIPGHWLRGVPCGIAPVAHGLAEVPKMVAICLQVVETVTSDDAEAITLVDRWPEIVAHRLADITPALCAAVLPASSSTSEAERQRLLETVRAYLRSGSVAEVAADVYCHRNTVVNRLRRFAELTGYDITRPIHAAAVSVALACEPDGTAKHRPLADEHVG